MTARDTPSTPPPAPRGRCLLGALPVLAGAGLLGGFLAFVEALPRREPAASPRTDAAVALTGGPERIGDALDLVARGRAERLLISGVHEATSPARLASLSGHHGLFDCCVDLGRRARDTVGNAEETGAWARSRGVRSLTVVTSAYHMPRSLVEMRRALPEVSLVAHPVVAPGHDLAGWWRRPATVRLLAAEYAKFLVAEARARLAPAPRLTPGPAPAITPAPGLRRAAAPPASPFPAPTPL